MQGGIVVGLVLAAAMALDGGTAAFVQETTTVCPDFA
jgi:hypothetical protein